MQSTDFLHSHDLVIARGDSFGGEWLLKLCVGLAIMFALFCAFCAGITWQRMDEAGFYLQKSHELLEQSAENEKATRDALKGMGLQQGSRDAGQVSSL